MSLSCEEREREGGCELGEGQWVEGWALRVRRERALKANIGGEEKE